MIFLPLRVTAQAVDERIAYLAYLAYRNRMAM